VSGLWKGSSQERPPHHAARLRGCKNQGNEHTAAKNIQAGRTDWRKKRGTKTGGILRSTSSSNRPHKGKRQNVQPQPPQPTPPPPTHPNTAKTQTPNNTTPNPPTTPPPRNPKPPPHNQPPQQPHPPNPNPNEPQPNHQNPPPPPISQRTRCRIWNGGRCNPRKSHSVSLL